MVKNAHSLTKTVKNQSLTTDISLYFRNGTCYISETVEDRWVHAARRLTSIEFSFDPCKITAIVPGAYPGEAKMCTKMC